MSDTRPAKRRALSPTSAQQKQLSALFANPDKPINLPSSTNGVLSTRISAPPDIVANVQGSSAGAGSGEFHVYKAARRREYERLKAMDEEAVKEKEDITWQAAVEGKRKEDEVKLGKNQAKRAKAKLRKEKGKKAGAPPGDASTQSIQNTEIVKRKLAPLMKESDDRDDVGEGHAKKSATADTAADVPEQQEQGLTFHDDD